MGDEAAYKCHDCGKEGSCPIQHPCPDCGCTVFRVFTDKSG